MVCESEASPRFDLGKSAVVSRPAENHLLTFGDLVSFLSTIHHSSETLSTSSYVNMARPKITLYVDTVSPFAYIAYHLLRVSNTPTCKATKSCSCLLVVRMTLSSRIATLLTYPSSLVG
jgi:hypothetical protein